MLQAEIQKPKYTKEQTVSWISHFKYGDVNSYEYQKRIIDTFVNAIYLFDDTLAITYNFNGCTEVITLKNIEAVYGSDLNVLFPLISESRNIPAFFCAPNNVKFYIQNHDGMFWHKISCIMALNKMKRSQIYELYNRNKRV